MLGGLGVSRRSDVRGVPPTAISPLVFRRRRRRTRRADRVAASAGRGSATTLAFRSRPGSQGPRHRLPRPGTASGTVPGSAAAAAGAVPEAGCRVARGGAGRRRRRWVVRSWHRLRRPWSGRRLPARPQCVERLGQHDTRVVPAGEHPRDGTHRVHWNRRPGSPTPRRRSGCGSQPDADWAMDL